MTTQYAPEITDWEQAIIPFGRSAGSRTRKVQYSPAHGIYRCVADENCTFTAPGYGAVFSHLKAHSVRRTATVENLDDLSLAVRNLQKRVDRLRKDTTGEWKTRALDAERRLAALRKALGH